MIQQTISQQCVLCWAKRELFVYPAVFLHSPEHLPSRYVIFLCMNSIPAWSKEFSYIIFLYRTFTKVNSLARADITSIHSQPEIKEIFDLKTHPFIN